jgi:hypothetical protein
MSTSQRTVSELEEIYLAAVARELTLRKYPDTILVERIRQKFTIIDDAEKLRKKLEQSFAAKKTRDIEKTLTLYSNIINEYEDIFRIEQKELDTIKSIIREVPILISMLESAVKHLPKVAGEASDSDKKIYKITLQELKSYLKEMKPLQEQRYKIDLTVKEALGVNKKTKSIKTRLDKLMISFEKKVEKFYDALSLMYKQARAKARAKSKSKKSKSKVKTKKKSKTKTVEKKSKEKALKSMIDMRVGVSDYVVFFKDTFKKLEKDFIKSKTNLQQYIPRAKGAGQGKAVSTIFTVALGRVNANHAAVKLLNQLKNMQSDFEKIKQKGNAIISQNEETSNAEIQGRIDVGLTENSSAMTDQSKHATYLRTAVLNAVSDFINQQSVKDAALYDLYTPLAQIPALSDMDDITGIINETLENSQHRFDEKFIKILKNNLAHAFKSIPYKFVDVATNTNEIIFDPSKGQEIINVNSVASALNERSALLDKGAHVLEDYNVLIEKFIEVYKTESHIASTIRNLSASLKTSFEKLKQKAAPYLYDNNINLLMGHITQALYVMEGVMLTENEAIQKTYDVKSLLKQLSTAIDIAAKGKREETASEKKTASKESTAKLAESQIILYNLIVDILSTNPEIKKSSQYLVNILEKQKLKSHYSESVGPISVASDLIAIGGAANESENPGYPSNRVKPGNLFTRKAASKRGHDFIELIGKLNSDFVKNPANVSKLIEDVKTFQKGVAKIRKDLR